MLQTVTDETIDLQTKKMGFKLEPDKRHSESLNAKKYGSTKGAVAF